MWQAGSTQKNLYVYIMVSIVMKTLGAKIENKCEILLYVISFMKMKDSKFM